MTERLGGLGITFRVECMHPDLDYFVVEYREDTSNLSDPYDPDKDAQIIREKVENAIPEVTVYEVHEEGH